MPGITAEQVHWAYQTFLHREPESEDVIADHLKAHDLTQLTRNFMESEEFRRTVPPAFIPLDANANTVEVDVDASTMELLVHHVRRCWEQLGRQRPHNSVITNPDFLPDKFARNEAAFWASGQQDAEVLLSVLARHGMKSVSRQTCVELGCGVGRITTPLAGYFAAVHGYDISAPHLDIARTRCETAQFHLLRELPVEFAPADVFYSIIVLQHNPPPIIAMLIRSALGCLKPGGIAVFQVPTYETDYSFRAGEYIERIKHGALDMEMHCLPQHHIFKIAAETGCRPLEVREETSTGRTGRDVSNMFVIQRQ